MYSALAGFVESGETIEDRIHREARGGVDKVGAIRYSPASRGICEFADDRAHRRYAGGDCDRTRTNAERWSHGTPPGLPPPIRSRAGCRGDRRAAAGKPCLLEWRPCFVAGATNPTGSRPAPRMMLRTIASPAGLALPSAPRSRGRRRQYRGGALKYAAGTRGRPSCRAAVRERAGKPTRDCAAARAARALRAAARARTGRTPQWPCSGADRGPPGIAVYNNPAGWWRARRI
jgi:hypothetical protein